jgi:hypothetical protein
VTTATDKIAEAKARVEQLGRDAEQARELEASVKSMGSDLEQHERKRDAYRVHGKNRIEVRNPYRSDDWPFLEFEPFRSKLTGDELAAGEEAECATLRAAIAEREAEIAELLK